jgi:hypothetical protein
MQRLALLLSLAALPALAAAALPAVPLLVELRWVDAALAPAAQAGVRDGAVVVGTAGAVSPRGAAGVVSTAPAAAAAPQQLRVSNGERASLRLVSREPLQWLDTMAELSPQGQLRGIRARPQPALREVVRRITVTPSWAGGRAPVRVAFEVEDEGQGLAATLDLPLERWHTVARTGGSSPPPPAGTLRSSDATAAPERELQMRVSITPPP